MSVKRLYVVVPYFIVNNVVSIFYQLIVMNFILLKEEPCMQLLFLHTALFQLILNEL